MLEKVLQAYQLDAAECSIQPFGIGLINNTWKLNCGEFQYILQKINNRVFKQPDDIAENISLLDDYLQKHYPGYLFVSPVKNFEDRQLVNITDEGWFRMFPFIKGSHTIDVVATPQQAYEAARQFALFTKQLSGFNAASLKITLPDFHNLTLRYRQFEEALKNGNAERISNSQNTILQLKNKKYIADEFELIKKKTDFKIRVTHHDTKISNVLFDKNDKGICVIDLDTVMPGYFFSDVGDMLRTYLSPAGEEEKDFSKIKIRLSFFDAVKEGYLSEMNDELSEMEKTHFIYAGKFMIYMQALRFFTDYLNNDVYYGSKYEGHNLNRANNQLVLLQQLAQLEII